MSKSKTKALSQVTSKIDVGHVGTMVSKYDEFGILLLQTRNIDEFFVNTEECQRITENFHRQLKKSQIKKDDVLIARSGSFGKASIYLEPEIINSADVIIVESNKDVVNPFYLVGFLNSKLGTSQLFRFASGGVQGHVNLTILESLLIPILNSNFQEFLESIIRFSYKTLRKSKELYQQAEDLLLSELGLKDWQPTDENIAVKSFSASFGTSDRLDAEYYQPKYDQLYNLLRSTSLQKGWELKRLESLSSVFKYGVSDALEYIESGVPFLRIADLQKYRFSESDLKFISHDAAKNYPATVQTGDVLISRSGTLGLAVVIPEYLNNAIYGSYFILTRPDQYLINPKYLAFYLNSLAGKLQTEQANTGGIQTNLTIPVLESLLIMCPPLDIQQRLVDKVNQSYEAQDQSKQLLEIAKTGVEKAIEENEELAINWINQQLKNLGIKNSPPFLRGAGGINHAKRSKFSSISPPQNNHISRI